MTGHGFGWALGLLLLAAGLLVIAVVLELAAQRRRPVPLLSLGLPRLVRCSLASAAVVPVPAGAADRVRGAVIDRAAPAAAGRRSLPTLMLLTAVGISLVVLLLSGLPPWPAVFAALACVGLLAKLGWLRGIARRGGDGGAS